jgi:hypothetical protein
LLPWWRPPSECDHVRCTLTVRIDGAHVNVLFNLRWLRAVTPPVRLYPVISAAGPVTLDIKHAPC